MAMMISMTSLKKAVIPAAGLGTRMLPAAKSVPKELLPILDRPTIQYVVEEASQGGLNDILLVTSPQKPALFNHFQPNLELEAQLHKSGKSRLIASINELMKKVNVSTVMQMEQKGLGDAVLKAREHVGNEPFMCLLGDTIFSGGIGPAAQLSAAYAKLGTAIIGLEEVPAEKVGRYGIIGGPSAGDGVIRIEQLVEKPSLDRAPSRLAICGAICADTGCFPVFKRYRTRRRWRDSTDRCAADVVQARADARRCAACETSRHRKSD